MRYTEENHETIKHERKQTNDATFSFSKKGTKMTFLCTMRGFNPDSKL